MAAVAAVMTPETIVVGDASYSTLWITNYLVSQWTGQRFLTPRGLAGLGWGCRWRWEQRSRRPTHR